MADECNIKVVCRVRPLNSSEEKAGSKFTLKFPTDDSISAGVSRADDESKKGRGKVFLGRHAT